jgi:putative transposase
MAEQQRKQYAAEFKLKVVMESFQRDTTQEEVCRKFSISSSMLHRWRKEFQEKAATIFLDKRDPRKKAQANGFESGDSPDELKKIIGELSIQNEILKKASRLLGGK